MCSVSLFTGVRGLCVFCVSVYRSERSLCVLMSLFTGVTGLCVFCVSVYRSERSLCVLMSLFKE